MNIRGILTLAVLLLAPLSAFPDWQVSTPESSVPHEPFFQAGMQQKTAFSADKNNYGNNPFPNQFANMGKPSPVYAISISGSIKENIERIMKRYKWRVIWKAPFDYNFDGKVSGSSLPNAIENLLKPFPLQAVMYMSNRTITILPRKRV